MRELVLRDWKLHKDALLLLTVVVLLMVPLGFLGLAPEELRFILPMLGRVAFGLGCLIPFLVHVRERQQGTFGDLLALPVARRDLVWLRWLEALLFGALFFLLATLPNLRQFTLRELADMHANWILAWVFLWVFAIQLPFQLRFGQKGGIAFGAVILFAEGWGMASLSPKALAESPVVIQGVAHAFQVPHRFWTSLGTTAPKLEILLLALLLGASFRFATLAAERCDA